MGIRRLDALVIDQIAAGEVIERPASVVKELVENALDAGAREILVEVEDGGRRLVRVRDDGAGIAAAELPLAVVSHATSKLDAVADLERIASFGFRGEALASIGAVARLRLRSRTTGEAAGCEIECRGGEVGEPRPVGCPPGTTVEVSDLFFNTPARKKFLRRPATELARITDLVSRLALADPGVGWTLRAGGRERLSLPRGMERRERIAVALGREFHRALEPVEGALGRAALTGFLADPGRLACRDTRRQLLFVNGRLVRDRRVAAAVQRGLDEALMRGMKPGFVLFLSLPPEEVDVNVHPAKTEVRFRAPDQVFSLVRRAAAHIAAAGDTSFREVGMEGLLPGSGTRPRPASTGLPLPAERPLFPSDLGGGAGPGRSFSGSTPPRSAGAAEPGSRRREGIDFLQVARTYLVVPWGEEGMALIDQHALHEKVLYEKLRRGLEAAGIARQRLLQPAVIELEQEVKEALLEKREVLARLGLEVEDFGDRALALVALPLPLAGADPGELVEEVARSLMAGRGARSAALEERIARAACRAAIKAGQRLDGAQVEDLVRLALTAEKPGHCPHGRPTVVTFTRAELEKLFKRR